MFYNALSDFDRNAALPQVSLTGCILHGNRQPAGKIISG